MAYQEIDIGSAPDAGDGDPLRTAFTKINENSTELYGTLGTLGTVYAGTGHDHNTLYSGTGHDHAALYSGTGHNHDTAYSGTGHTHATLYIGTGVPSATGYAVMTAASQAAGRTAIAAGTSNFDGAYGSLSGAPSLGDLSSLNLSGTDSTFLNGTGGWGAPVASAGWGAITGTLADQTDLQAALDAKQGTGAYLLGTYTSHAHATLYIGTGVPTVTGYALMTAADAAAGRTAISAGTSNFDGAYASLSGNPTLGSVSTLNTNGTAAYYLNGTGGWSIPPGTATGGGGGGATIRYGRVTSISTGTGTAYADVTGLSCGISPNEVLQVHAYIMGGCNGTGGSRLTMTVPTGATAKFTLTGNGASATAYTMAVCTAGGQDPGVTLWNANSTARMAEIHGIVANGTTSGTVQVRRRNVVGTFITTVDVNSHLNGMVTS